MDIATPGLDDPALDRGVPDAPGSIFTKFCQLGVTLGRAARACVLKVLATSGFSVCIACTSDETTISCVVEPTFSAASTVAVPTPRATGPCTSFSKPGLVKVIV